MSRDVERYSVTDGRYTLRTIARVLLGDNELRDLSNDAILEDVDGFSGIFNAIYIASEKYVVKTSLATAEVDSDEEHLARLLLCTLVSR